MMKCPKCNGIGKTISTRNSDIAIIRWHKCKDCGFSFTSTQTVDYKYNDGRSSDYLKSLVDSNDFKIAMNPLFYITNIHESNWLFEKECPNLIFMPFLVTNDRQEKLKLTIKFSLNEPNVYGVVSIANENSDHSLNNMLFIGQIKYDGESWSTNFDFAQLNALNNINHGKEKLHGNY